MGSVVLGALLACTVHIHDFAGPNKPSAGFSTYPRLRGKLIKVSTYADNYLVDFTAAMKAAGYHTSGSNSLVQWLNSNDCVDAAWAEQHDYNP